MKIEYAVMFSPIGAGNPYVVQLPGDERPQSLRILLWDALNKMGDEGWLPCFTQMNTVYGDRWIFYRVVPVDAVISFPEETLAALLEGDPVKEAIIEQSAADIARSHRGQITGTIRDSEGHMV